MKHIHYEDENSRYITIGCVEKVFISLLGGHFLLNMLVSNASFPHNFTLQVLCMLACWVEDPEGDYFKKHLARIPDYLWVAEDGMKMQVLNLHFTLLFF